MFALALPIEGQCVGTTRQGSTAVSVCSALKVWAQLLQGIQFMHHVLSIAAITVSPCLGVSLPLTFLYGAHPRVGLERGAHGRSFPSLHRAGTCRCWHVTHGAAGQAMNCTQCTKSQPCPQGTRTREGKSTGH